MSWFSDLFGRGQADDVELGLLVADQRNPYEDLTLDELRQVLADREALRDAQPTYNCEVCGNTWRVDCDDCTDSPGWFPCGTCDGQQVTRCHYCRGRGHRSGYPCDDCGGLGWETCRECLGQGEVDCPTCEGSCWVDCPMECWARAPHTGDFYQ